MTEKPPLSALNLTHAPLMPSLKRYGDILHAADLGSWEWNVQTGGVSFNERWASMLGYTLEDLSPLSIDTWVSLIHPEDLERSNALLELHFRGQSKTFECECRLRHKNGEWVWILTRGAVITRTRDGAPLLVCGIHLDITAQKRVIDALQDSEHTYELIALGTSGALYDWDVQTDTVTWRGRSYEIMGVAGNEELPLNSADFQRWIHPDDHEKYRRRLRLYFKKEIPVLKDTVRLLHRDGQVMWVEYNGAAMWNAQGRATRLFGSFTDINDYHSARTRAHECLAAMTSLSAQLGKTTTPIAAALKSIKTTD